ncbi:putative secreted protein [Wickerhamomyces ciferrii]|uniref:Secreted protein n=1 Tax=Wickerhamomyces ciferrii (strain ATCC 14091 / BCRC 22168 / CBS 111 / JCM 3599 / NBRC 0793 / NRRL Y-1031 F-60-10) TaxID=1206466 RepID=K0KDB3_WICCF|nr:uncharacterized protein BN7_425 [Wickerhamomyces ciferrii]CCH40891.1 putative secreted protein [Wickerhamomyces ciferrii]
MTTTVLLTGASGFIALHIIDVLLSKGYKVIGTVRSQSKADKIIKNFQNEKPSGDLSFEIVEDISIPNAFDHVLEKHPEITKVIHAASPFFYGVDKDSLKTTYLVPATKGTENILTAIDKFGSKVENVVITSSFAAIVHRHKLARKYISENKVSYELTTVNPPFVLGPQKFEDVLINPTLNTSAETINKLLKTDPSDEHFFDTPLGLATDVRDVALLHVLPLEDQNLKGKRLFPVNGAFNGQTLLNVINKNFKDLKIAKGKPEGAEEHVAKNHWFYDSSKSLEWSGLGKWIPLEKTIIDSVSQILEYQKANEK